MAENIPPASSTNSQNASTTTNADQPGRPYYESLRSTLRSTLEKKRKLDESLALIEDQIFKSEGAYLEETAGSGNIVRGFDGWVKGVSLGSGRGGGAGGDERRRGKFREEDRVFSRSSVSWMRAQEGGPDSATPSHAPTPTASFAPQTSTRASENGSASTVSKAANKKKRPQEREEDGEGKTAKRGKITYARD